MFLLEFYSRKAKTFWKEEKAEMSNLQHMLTDRSTTFDEFFFLLSALMVIYDHCLVPSL